LKGNKWNGIKYIKHKVSICLIPFPSLCSRHYYELSSPQQPPLIDRACNQQLCMHLLKVATQSCPWISFSTFCYIAMAASCEAMFPGQQRPSPLQPPTTLCRQSGQRWNKVLMCVWLCACCTCVLAYMCVYRCVLANGRYLGEVTPGLLIWLCLFLERVHLICQCVLVCWLFQF
jgi:hypothetical protein